MSLSTSPTLRFVSRTDSEKPDRSYCEIGGEKWVNAHEDNKYLGSGDSKTYRYNHVNQHKQSKQDSSSSAKFAPKVIKKILTAFASAPDVDREVKITEKCLGECHLIETDSKFIFVQPFVSGVTIETFIDDVKIHRRTLSCSALMAICQAVLKALDEIHKKGIVHRDIHHGNVLILQTGLLEYVAHCVDFGSARDMTEHQVGPGYDINDCRYVFFHCMFDHVNSPTPYITKNFEDICEQMKLEKKECQFTIQELIPLLKQLETLSYFVESQDQLYEQHVIDRLPQFRHDAQFANAEDLREYLSLFEPHNRWTILKYLDPALLSHRDVLPGILEPLRKTEEILRFLTLVPENKRIIVMTHYAGFITHLRNITELKTVFDLLPNNGDECYQALRHINVEGLWKESDNNLERRKGLHLQQLLDTALENAGAKREAQQFAFLKVFVWQVIADYGRFGSQITEPLEKLSEFKDSPNVYQNLLFALGFYYATVRNMQAEYTGSTWGYRREQKVAAANALVDGPHDCMTIVNLRNSNAIYRRGKNLSGLTTAIINSFTLFRTTVAPAKQAPSAPAATAATAGPTNPGRQ